MKKGLAEGLSYTGLQMQDMRRRLLSTEESRDTLRTRVAKLEGLLVRVSERPGLTAVDHADIRAALKGG